MEIKYINLFRGIDLGEMKLPILIRQKRFWINIRLNMLLSVNWKDKNI